MKLKISSETLHIETGVSEIHDQLKDEGLCDYFKPKVYGDPDFRIFAVLSCMPPEFNAKRRRQYSREENVLRMDIGLNFGEMTNAGERQKKDIVAEEMLEQISQALRKCRNLDFDADSFSKDLHSWFEEHNWLSKPS